MGVLNGNRWSERQGLLYQRHRSLVCRQSGGVTDTPRSGSPLTRKLRTDEVHVRMDYRLPSGLVVRVRGELNPELSQATAHGLCCDILRVNSKGHSRW